jgi:endonuclease/exonuclease/phosphatase family metal-dependent hydrolase
VHSGYVPDDGGSSRKPFRRARAVPGAVAAALLVVVAGGAAAVVSAARDHGAGSSGPPGAPVSTAPASAAPDVTDLHPAVRPALQPDPPVAERRCSDRRPVVLRVLQFNIHAAIDRDTGDPELSAVAAEIEAADPDLVSLNEVDDGTLRSGGADEASYLSRATGLHAVFGPTLLGYDGGRFGNAILSRYPVLDSQDLTLPQITDFEARALLTATIRVDQRTVSFSSLHLSSGSANTADRVLEAEAVARVLRRAQHPTIVAGDLNSEPTDLPVSILRQYLLDAQEQSGSQPGYTIPETDPTGRIDYVLYDNHFTSVAASTRVLPSAVSDHRSLLTELTLRPPGRC